MIKARVIDSIEDLRSLAGGWNKLLEKSNADSICLTFEWITSWYDVCTDKPSLFVVVIEDAADPQVAIDFIRSHAQRGAFGIEHDLLVAAGANAGHGSVGEAAHEK